MENSDKNQKSPLQVAMEKLNQSVGDDVEKYASFIKERSYVSNDDSGSSLDDKPDNSSSRSDKIPSFNELAEQLKQRSTAVGEIAEGLFGSLSGQLKQFRQTLQESRDKMAENDLGQDDSGVDSNLRDKWSDEDSLSQGDNKKAKFIKPKRVEPATQNTTQKQQTPKSQPATPAQNKNKVPHEIINDMSVLLSSMTGRIINADHSNNQWSTMNAFGDSIKEQWVKVISDSKNISPSAPTWLSQWEDIVLSVMQESKQWDAEKSAKWSSWASSRSEEIKSLSPWFKKDTEIDCLEVPKEFKNKGKIPHHPISTPQNYVDDLALCADFFEYAKSSPTFSWEDSPAQKSFEKKQKLLEKWTPRNQYESSWKESGLDSYSVLWAKLATVIPPSLKTNLKNRSDSKSSLSVATKEAVKKSTKKSTKKTAKSTVKKATKKVARKKGLAKR